MINTEIVIVLYSLSEDEFSISTLADVIELNRSNSFKRIESDYAVVASAGSYDEADEEAERLRKVFDARESTFLEEILENADICEEYTNLDRGEESYQSLLDELEQELEY